MVRSVKLTVLERIRIKLVVFVAGLLFAAIGVLTWAALPVLPVVGVAVATAAFVASSMTSRLAKGVCHGCGQRLGPVMPGEHGVLCPNCGRLDSVRRVDRG